MIDQLLGLALAPVLYAQGRAVRRRIPRLPEPTGARAGKTGRGIPLRLLIAGDSAAAGVGAESQAEALSGQLVLALNDHFRLDWRLEAGTGATTRQTIARLRSLVSADESGFDVLVTSLGVNDLTRHVGEGAWLESQRELRRLAREELGVRLLVIAGLPPIDRFPALPHPLRWYLGRRAIRFTSRLRADLACEPSAHLLDLRLALDPQLMAPDGFHPGPRIYAEWARRVADIICRNLPPSPHPDEQPRNSR